MDSGGGRQRPEEEGGKERGRKEGEGGKWGKGHWGREKREEETGKWKGEAQLQFPLHGGMLVITPCSSC